MFVYNAILFVYISVLKASIQWKSTEKSVLQISKKTTSNYQDFIPTYLRLPSPPPYNILKPASWLVRQQVGLDSSDGWMDAGFSSTRSIDQLGRLGGKGCCMWGWRRWSEEREWRWLRWEGNGGVEGYEGDINAVRGLHILNRVRTRRRWERMSHTRIEIGW